MLSFPRPVRTAVVGAAAAATVVAGLTVLTSTPASAASANSLRIEAVYPDDRSGSAGTCQIFRAVPTDQLGRTPSDSGTIVITLKENPKSDAQDVDFCLPPTAPDGRTGVRVDHGYYTNGVPAPGDPPTAGTRQRYAAGRSVTPPAATSTPGGTPQTENSPDVANGDAARPTRSSATTPTQRASTTSTTSATAPTPASPTSDFVEFGVVGLVPGSAFIDARIERGNDDVNAAPGRR